MKYPYAFAALATVLAAPAWAGDDWTTTTGAQGVYGSYSGSVQRDSVTGYGAAVTAEHREKGGATLMLNHTAVKMKPGNADIDQNALFASGRLNFKSGEDGGTLTTRMDVHAIDNDDATKDTDEVTAYAPQVSYLSADKRRYADLGYAHTDYRNNLSVDQWTPTAGFLLGQNNWLQVRGWFIEPSNPARAQGKDSTSAVEGKLTHWFGPAQPLGLNNVRLSLLAGERIYAVDQDAGSVSNLSDIQRGSLSLGGEWKIGKTGSAIAILGREQNRNATLGNDYDLTYGYLWLSGQW
ncbi:MAG: hypothetical protein KJ558_02035 [Gammaproteobacteria bacterium]|nr:hypothetical protein [Gammaproteobacteria bacterium]MBU1653609.1 hypothetical protein [Gammaproteobacteria bacterium]MBU1960974.1 hypothetical protein [Gammaproteobacteria bacterium]